MRRIGLTLALLAMACAGEEFTSTGGGAGSSGGASGSGGSAAAGGTAGAAGSGGGAGASGGGTAGTASGGTGGSAVGGGGAPSGGSGGSATGGKGGTSGGGGAGGATGGTGGATGGAGGATGGTGGGGACPTIPVAAAFPSTTVFDNFNLADGAIDGTKWGGSLAAFGIKGQQLIHKTGSSGDYEILTKEGMCPDQEAWVTIKKVDTAAKSIGLQLKTQPAAANCEQIEVDYVPSGGYIHVVTCAGGTWTEQGSFITKTLTDGTQFGARTRAVKSTVEVFVNGTLLASVPIVGFPHMPKGGRIGLAVWQGTGTAAFDDFGGGP